jgi:hypothetical protein
MQLRAKRSRLQIGVTVVADFTDRNTPPLTHTPTPSSS